MHRRTILSRFTIAAVAVTMASGSVIAQQKPLKDRLMGTWTLVSSDTVQQNGSRSPTFGPNPKGIAIFDTAGHYVFEFTNSSLPKFAANNRTTGTAEENKSVVQGSLGPFRYLHGQ